jgi:hypothetical protein
MCTDFDAAASARDNETRQSIGSLPGQPCRARLFGRVSLQGILRIRSGNGGAAPLDHVDAVQHQRGAASSGRGEGLSPAELASVGWAGEVRTGGGEWDAADGREPGIGGVAT